MVAELNPRVGLDELRSALETILSGFYQSPCSVSALHRRRSRYSSSCTIENLVAEINSKERLRLVLKDTSRKAILAFGHNVRPSLLAEPPREVEVYQKLLHSGLGTPLCYGSVCSTELERYWLFLERVEGVGLWQFGSIEVWQETARWLARLHSQLAVNSRSPSFGDCRHLLDYDRQYFSFWLRRAEEFLYGGTVSAPAQERRRFAQLLDRFDRVLERLDALPRSFVHGEFYPSNVLIRRSGPSGLICPVDWETAGIGPALLDLAALTSGKWNEEARTAMLTAYRDALEPSEHARPTLSELKEAVDCCQLEICIQWLGWAQSWSPPAEHSQDWLREALRLAEKLAI